jgi:hypothetical protein
VADPEGRTGYVANGAGGIDALDLATGRRLWSTADADRPLAVAGRTLAAQVSGKHNSLRIAVLDTSQGGKLVSVSDPVVFPDWVGVTYDHTFVCGGTLSKDDLILQWQARVAARHPGWAYGTPERAASGVARINLETGRVEMPADESATPPRVELPAGAKQLTKRLAALQWESPTLLTYPKVGGEETLLLVGDRLVGLQTEGTNEAYPHYPGATARETYGRLLLRSWDLPSGAAHEPVELCRGLPWCFWWRTLPNEGYVLATATSPQHHSVEGNTVGVFSLISGKKVGQFRPAPRMHHFGIRGPHVFGIEEAPDPPSAGDHTIPRVLKAFDITSGKLLWEWPIAGRRVSAPKS